ncbi:membrane metallo-endopeptidase-like 1 [Diachasmimorpha longicaudata]|uniref:membrane metallo-endopeptidase-like 1 n=1 Tax=Diachasmimorpha longicaudata TaxID=58733 RepID=UPI0030B86BA9
MFPYRAYNYFNFTIILGLTLCSLSHSLPAKRDTSSISTVDDVLRSLDESVNPCDDFYAYTCGNWEQYHPTEEGYDIWTTVQTITNSLTSKIGAILAAPNLENDTQSIRKARQIYQACMNDEKIEQDGIEPIKSLINELGGWPLIMKLEEWKSKDIKWQPIVTKLVKERSLDTLLSIEIEADPKNSAITRMIIGEPSLYLKRHEILAAEPGDNLLQSYNQYKFNIADIFRKASGTPTEGLTASTQLIDMNTFEWKLAKISDDDLDVKDIDKWYSLMTIDELQTFYDSIPKTTTNSQINWLELIREVASLTPDVTIDGSEKVVVASKRYFTELSELLDKTEPETIVNYLVWRIILDSSLATNNKMRELLQLFGANRMGADNIPDRKDTCASPAPLETAVSYEFIKKYSSPEVKQGVTELITNIQQAVEQHLERSSWLDTETKKLATEKIHVMGKFISYPDYYSPAFVDGLYTEYPASDSYYDNEMAKRVFTLKNKLRSLRKATDKKTWPAEPTEVNAFYIPVANTMQVPSGIIQSPLYDLNNPSVMNYGMIGTTIGHEFSHSLDSKGRRYDKNGDVVTWWSQSALDKYEERAQCYVNQYNNFILYESDDETVHLNGTITMGENISDTEGLVATWDAYKIAREKAGNKTVKIPGLERFTDEQIFFISFGYSWCTNYAPGYFKRNANSEEHSPSKPRVNGAVANNEVFATAFNCPANSPMNPMNKCSMWK